MADQPASHFKKALTAVILVTLLCFAGHLTVVLVTLGDTTPNPICQGFAETCSKGSLIGLGALVGLVGGKAL